MGIDSRGVYRGGCSHPGCSCREFQRDFSTSKCIVCQHLPTSHPVSPQQNDVTSGKRTSPTHVAPHNGHSHWESQSSQPHHHSHPPRNVIGRMSGWKTCYTCGTGYFSVDSGACPKCCLKEACKSGCAKPAFCSLEPRLFGYLGHSATRPSTVAKN